MCWVLYRFWKEKRNEVDMRKKKPPSGTADTDTPVGYRIPGVQKKKELDTRKNDANEKKNAIN